VSSCEGLAVGLFWAFPAAGGTEPALADAEEAPPADVFGEDVPLVPAGFEALFDAEFLSTDISIAWNKVKTKESTTPMAGPHISYSIG